MEELTLRLGVDKGRLLKLVWLAAFAVGMAYVEAAVVAYLRYMYYTEGFVIESLNALDSMSPTVLRIEVWREAATIVMLASIALLAAGRSWWERLAYFIWAFAFWDVFYYAWLFVLLRWPPSLLTLDVLFLIPVAWVAPVLLPVTVSGMMMVVALVILRRT